MTCQASVILLVDDDPETLDILGSVLTAGGYRVVCSSDPEEALRRAAGEKIDLVITDLMMGTLDSGFAFSRRIKEAPHLRHVPVIILTAIGARRGFDFRPRTPGDLEAMCADAYLEKPAAPQELLKKVEELLRRPGREDAP